MTEPNIAVKFGKSNSAKIRVIQAAIDDPTTYLKVLEGLIDIGYANALKTLYHSKQIDQETFDIGQRQLPKHLRSFRHRFNFTGSP